jgi:hypothetical protein
MNASVLAGTLRVRRALTLVEMMVAVAVTLILLFAILKLAALIGSSSETGRSILELSGEIRAACNRLQADLDKLTCKGLAWIDPSAGPGYFEYREGPLTDANETLVGDVDDWLAGTCYSPDQPFVGRGLGGSLTSDHAEVVWWVTQENLNGTTSYRVRRRAFLIQPNINLSSYTAADVQTLLTNYDISFSVRNGQVVANSLADLSRREYRTIHQPAGTPANFPFGNNNINLMALQGNLQGEDVVLGRCLAMDVRAYDPYAPIAAGVGVSPLAPGDPGYSVGAANNSPVGRGAYVDLNYGTATGGPNVSWFSGMPNPKSGLQNINTVVYDFWSSHYENDGVDQDGAFGPDQGVDGLDNNAMDLNNTGVDDASERETSPPYPVPLRGIRVTLRAYDPSSRQVRQASVVGDFTPN